MKGWVYIASNKALESVYKVGFSDRDPQIRMVELSNTSVPFEFQLIYAALVDDANFVEQKTHDLLAGYRVSKQREFFNCDLLFIFDTIQSVCADNSKKIYHEEKNELFDLDQNEKTYKLTLEDILKIRDFFIMCYQEKTNEIILENDNQYYAEFRKKREQEFVMELNKQLSKGVMQNWMSSFNSYKWTNKDAMLKKVKKEITTQIHKLLIEYGITVYD